MYEYYIHNGLPIWALLIRQGDLLPKPTEVDFSAYSLKRPFLEPGIIHLGVNDAVIEGWSRYQHPRPKLRAWIMMGKPETEQVSRTIALGRDKTLMRMAIKEGRCNMPLEYLGGRGEIAALVRILHALRGGMSISEFDNNS